MPRPSTLLAAAQLTVSLVTAGSGAEPITWLGHSALLIRDARRGTTMMVDYGAIEGGPGVVSRALAGRLRAVVRVRDGDRALAALAALARQGRSVSVLTLRLRDDAVRALVRRVETDLATDRGRYLYRYDRDNCATRLRDHLDAALGGRLRAIGAPAAETLRERGMARVYPRNALAALTADLLVNGDADRPATTWTLAAQPAGLEALVRAATIDSAGIAIPLAVEQPAPGRAAVDEPAGAPPSPSALAFVGALAAALVVGAAGVSARWGRLALGALSALAATLLGTLGALIAAAWAFTDYAFTRGNENLLVANPLALLLVPAAVAFAAGSARAGRLLRLGWGALGTLAVAALALKLVPGFDQDNGRALAAAVPLTLGLAVAFARAAPAPTTVPSPLTLLEVRA